MGEGHPECAQRLDAIGDQLRATGLDIALDYRDAPLATEAQLLRAHTAGYVADILDRMRRVRGLGEHHAVDPDTTIGAGTLHAALRAAGAAAIFGPGTVITAAARALVAELGRRLGHAAPDPTPPDAAPDADRRTRSSDP